MDRSIEKLISEMSVLSMDLKSVDSPSPQYAEVATVIGKCIEKLRDDNTSASELASIGIGFKELNTMYMSNKAQTHELNKRINALRTQYNKVIIGALKKNNKKK